MYFATKCPPPTEILLFIPSPSPSPALTLLPVPGQALHGQSTREHAAGGDVIGVKGPRDRGHLAHIIQLDIDNVSPQHIQRGNIAFFMYLSTLFRSLLFHSFKIYQATLILVNVLWTQSVKVHDDGAF